MTLMSTPAGMVVVPLIASLYDLDHDDARQYVCAATKANRASEGGCDVHIPETAEQVAASRGACPEARALERPVSGNHAGELGSHPIATSRYNSTTL
jgi:hypothetical protein